jgi:hypothetical protein
LSRHPILFGLQKTIDPPADDRITEWPALERYDCGDDPIQDKEEPAEKHKPEYQKWNIKGNDEFSFVLDLLR